MGGVNSRYMLSKTAVPSSWSIVAGVPHFSCGQTSRHVRRSSRRLQCSKLTHSRSYGTILPPSFPAPTQVAVDHLNMLISLVEEMTSKWERQLEDGGEGSWSDDMLAREGTEGETMAVHTVNTYIRHFEIDETFGCKARCASRLAPS